MTDARWALSEESAQHHWWASANLKKKATGTGGPSLVSAYNVMTQARAQSFACKLTPLPRFMNAFIAFQALVATLKEGQGRSAVHFRKQS